MYLYWFLSKATQMPFRFAFCSVDRAGDTSALLMIALGTTTLALPTALMGLAGCGENSMTENYCEVSLADNSRRNHACANRISRRAVCTGI